MVLRDFNELLARAKLMRTKRIVVAMAGEENVLEAIRLALENQLIQPILVGRKKEIEVKAGKVGLKLNKIEVINSLNIIEACRKAVQLVSSGEADLLMKGLVETSFFMRAVLNKEYGLRTGHLISHITMVESKLSQRILFITDGGINIKPNLQEKKEIIENVILVAHKLGYEKPKIAVLAAIEKVNPNMFETIEAAALSKMADRGQISGGFIDGPLAIDNAVSKEAAKIKGITSPVAGKADILIVPEIIAGNLLGKSCVYFAGDRIATIIGGTTKPVVLTSRASSAEIKLISIAAAALISE